MQIILCHLSEIPLIKFSFSFFLQSHNDFVAILDLPEGEHQYKFFVDGQWVHDISEVSCFNISLCFKPYCLLLFMFLSDH